MDPLAVGTIAMLLVTAPSRALRGCHQTACSSMRNGGRHNCSLLDTGGTGKRRALGDGNPLRRPGALASRVVGPADALGADALPQEPAASLRTFVRSNSHFNRCSAAEVSSARITAWLSSP